MKAIKTLLVRKSIIAAAVAASAVVRSWTTENPQGCRFIALGARTTLSSSARIVVASSVVGSYLRTQRRLWIA